jgi:hypothetical protein
MSAFLAFLGILLMSLLVSLLVSLQLADYFAATDEFALVLLTLPVFVTACLVVFIAVNRLARRPQAFNAAAACLALLAFVPLALPLMQSAARGRATDPFQIAMENSALALQLVVPALAAVLVQWGLVRRRWLRQRGEDDLSLWPWIATIVSGLAILNPYGLDAIGQAVGSGPSVWLREAVRTVALGGTAALLILVFVETYIRGRMLRRRLAQGVG